MDSGIPAGGFASRFTSSQDQTTLNGSATDILARLDPEAARIAKQETKLRSQSIPLIASENFPSAAVAAAAGLPGLAARNMESTDASKPFYQGEGAAHAAQILAVNRATALFGCKHANVQPFSGSTANTAALKAMLPREHARVLCMTMADGGHFTHGASENIAIHICDQVANYPVDKKTGLIDYEAAEHTALRQMPHLLIVGGSNYPREIDFKRMRAIVDKVNGEFSREGSGEKCYLMADIAHYAGLIAGGAYPSPFPYADIVTSTTHKTLRGPRGGIILWNDDKLTKQINDAVCPGVQGEPHPASILAKAVAFKEAMQPEFKDYAHGVVANAKALQETLQARGLQLLTGGTDCHMVLVDLRPLGLDGEMSAQALENCGLIANKMSIPYQGSDGPAYSGLRLGTAAATTLGMKQEDFKEIGAIVADVLDELQKTKALPAQGTANPHWNKVQEICQKHHLAEQIGAGSSGALLS